MKLLFPIVLTFGVLITGAQETPLACNRLALDPVVRQRHFDVLGPALRAMHRQTRELADGFEFEFPADSAAVQKVAEWAAGERLCCPFFDVELRFPRDRGGFWLRLTGGRGVKEFIRADFDRWFRP
jgi:hypothetical protein